MKQTLVKITTSILILASVLIIDCKKSNNPPNPPEIPSGSSSGRINIAYDFITSAIDPDEDSISYQFDWGDGTQSVWSSFKLSGASVTISKSWAQIGTYLIKAIAKDTKGALSDWSDECVVTISANHTPNIPSIPSGPATGSVNLLYNFTTSTTDPDGDSVSYQFDWGNNDTSNWSAYRPGNNSITMSHTWTDTGIYAIRARAKDNKANISDWSSSHIIHIIITTNHSPNTPLSPSGPSSGHINTSYNFTALTTDPEDDSISYQFDWGNGVLSNWSGFVSSGISVTMSQIWSDSGTYSIKVRAKDVEGATSDWSIGHSINIVITANHTPNIPTVPNGFSSGYINTLYNFTTSTTDPDGDSVSYQFDWGDGTQSDWSTLRPSGTSIMMSKQWSQAGVYSIKARAKDIEQAISDWSDGHSITITVNNPPNVPSVPNGPASGIIDTIYDFTTSTSDPENDSISYQFDWGNGVTSTWSGFIPSGTTITMSNTWTDSGTYAVKARAKDTKGFISNWSNGHSIHIVAFVNQAPNTPSTPSGPSSGIIDTTYSFTTLTTDPDGDSISYQFDWGNGITSSWSSFRPSGNSITMSYSWVDSGSYNVKARARDEQGAISNWSNSHSIHIVVFVNHAPNIPSTPSGPSSGIVNTNYSFSTSATDPDDDSISYQFDWGNGVLSNWSSFRPSGSSITMSYAWTDSGAYNIKVRAKDQAGAISDWSNEHSIHIVAIVNHTPNTPSTPSGPSSGAINTVYNFTTSTIDPDGDSISYQFDWGNGIISHWSNFIANGTPITMMQAWADSGIYQIRARAKDPQGATSDWSSAHTIVITTTDTSFPRQVVATISVGDEPLGVAVLPNGNYIYVTNHNGDNVSVIQTSNNSVVGTITVGNGPMDLTVLPNGNFVYVPNRFSNDVTVIRTTDNVVTASIQVGSWPVYCAATPNCNFVYTANWQTDDVSVIRTSDNTVIAAISVGDGPGGVCVLPNGNYAYVSNMSSNNVSVIRTLDNTVVATIPTAAYPQGIIALPNGDYVYVADKTGNSVTVIRTSDNTVVATIPVSNGPVRLCALPNSNYVYVTQEYGSNVVIIRTSDNTVVATIPVGQYVAGVVSLPNGNYVYVAVFQSDVVKVIGR
jgi:YVTN family beta-propeller protein